MITFLLGGIVALLGVFLHAWASRGDLLRIREAWHHQDERDLRPWFRILRRAWRRFRALLPLALLFFSFSCSGPESTAGGGGAGGALATSGSSTSSWVGASKSSASGSQADASTDALGCSTCKDALYGAHLQALENLCPGDGGDGPFAYWAQYLNCGCAMGGACETDCSSDAWCQGLFPVTKSWIDPGAPCATCLDTTGPTGCGEAASSCSKH